MKLKFIFLSLLFLSFGHFLCAQPRQLAGLWTGYLHNDTTGQNMDFELAINQSGKKYNGFTYTVFLIEGKKNIGIKTVKINEKKEVLFLEDIKLIDNNYAELPAKGVRTFITLHFSENDTAQILSGVWKTNRTTKYNSVTGSIYLTRNNRPEETAIIPKLRELDLLTRLSFMPEYSATLNGRIPDNQTAGDHKIEMDSATDESVKIIPDTTIVNEEITIYMYPKENAPSEADKVKPTRPGTDQARDSLPVKTKNGGFTTTQVAAAKLADREIETIRTVTIQRDSLEFSLFDNGSIDGDTVSVLLNGQVIMPKVGLLARAVNKTLHLTPEMGDSITIILYAENLGTMAPNTGLLVIRDGTTNHEIRFSGDLKKNAAIIIKRKNKIYEQ